LGAHGGAGATTLAVTLANYISAFLRRKTAIAEYSAKSDFSKLQADKDNGSFTIRNVDYYSKNSTDMCTLEHKGYDVVVVDFGCNRACMGDFMRCTHKIILSGLELWNIDRYEQFCESLSEYAGSDTWLHILHGDKAEIKRLMRAYGIYGIKRPDIDNAYVIGNELVQFFQTLF